MTKNQIAMLCALIAGAEASNEEDPVGCVLPTSLIIKGQEDKPVMGSLLKMGLIGTSPKKVWLTAEGVLASQIPEYNADRINEAKKVVIDTLSEDIPGVTIGEVWCALMYMSALEPLANQIKYLREREQ